MNEAIIFITTHDKTSGWTTEVSHDVEGIIFGMGSSYNEELQVESFTYKKLEDSPEWIAALRTAISNGKFEQMTYFTLVRHGEPWKKGGYYPIPLLFSTETIRMTSAEGAGKLPPPNRWVRRKRNEVLKVLGLTNFKEVGQSE